MTATTLVRLGDAALGAPLPVEGTRTVLDTDATGAVQNTTDTILYADNFDYSGRDGAGHRQRRRDQRDRRPHHVARRLAERDPPLHLRSQRRLRGLLARAAPATTCSASRWTSRSWGWAAPGTAATRSRASATTGGSTTRPASTSRSRTTAPRAATTTPRIGARQQGGSNSHTMSGTPYFLKYTFDGGWQLLVDGDLGRQRERRQRRGRRDDRGLQGGLQPVAQPGHPGAGQQGDRLPGRCHAGRLHRFEASGCPGGSIWPAATTSPSSTT